MVSYRAVPFRWAIPITFLAFAATVACGPGTFDHFKYSVKIGAKDEVRYQGDATKEDALALGEVLRSKGFFRDQGFLVVLDKTKGGTAVSVAVNDGEWNDAKVVDGFENLGRDWRRQLGDILSS